MREIVGRPCGPSSVQYWNWLSKGRGDSERGHLLLSGSPTDMPVDMIAELGSVSPG